MTGGRASRQKGNRLERALVHALQEAGFAAERVPLNGSGGGSYTGDLIVPPLGRGLRAEAKARTNAFNQLYAWLAAADLLIVRRDRAEPLVVVPLKLAVEVATAAVRLRNPDTVGSEICCRVHCDRAAAVAVAILQICETAPPHERRAALEGSLRDEFGGGDNA
jgi:Holliday junction resolvase